MEQKSLLVLMFVGVLTIFGGLIFYDIQINDRLGNSNNSQSNWIWSDKWDSQNAPTITQPQPEQQPQEVAPEVPQGQIVANNYQDAIKKSGEFKKPVMIMFSANWCGWCTKMKSGTLQDAKVKQALKDYIILMIDTDKDKNTTKKFGVRSLPSFVITNSKEEKLKSGTGYKDANNFSAWLNNPTLLNN